MNRFGIFIGFGATIDIRAEGIGRLLAMLMDGAVRSDVRITVLAPHWYRQQLSDLLDDNKLDAGAVEIITTGGVPIGVRLLQAYTAIRTWRTRQKQERRKRGRLARALRALGGALNAARRFVREAFFGFVSSSSPLAWLAAALLAPLALLLLLASVPTVLAAHLLRWANRRLVQVPAQRALGSGLVMKLRRWLRHRLVPIVSATVEQRERERMVRIANTRPDIPVWYIPTIFWPEVRDLTAPKVLAAPDIVYAEFPNYFVAENFRRTKVRIMAAVSEADRLICYSRHVADHHLAGYAGVEPERIKVIHHGAFRLDQHLKAPRNAPALRRQAAVEELRRFQAQRIADPFWAYLRFEDIPFVVYSSQGRPYKNIYSLVRAIALLVQERGVNIRLVTTADMTGDAREAGQLVASLGLQDFVLSVPRIPSETLAAFNHLAVCSVNPTLFEGGFPFTFSEAYSVGTPSVMSRIPAVLERMTSPELADVMLFDPYDVDAMADRILYAMRNREQLLELQRPLYEAHEDWTTVARHYVAAITGTR